MKLFTARRETGGDENVIPLINVVFLLLIFFMIVASVKSPDLFALNPPSAVNGADARPSEIDILLAADGRLALAGQPVSESQLALALKSQLAEYADYTVVRLKADGGVSAGQLGRVFGALRAAGVEHLSLITQRPL